MSYITKRGSEAAQAAMSEKKDYSKALVSLKSGTTFTVALPSNQPYVQYFAHSIYKKFYTAPCTKGAGKPDLYDQAVDVLYKEAEQAEEAGNKAEAEELRKFAYQLKAKERYLLGFFNLEDGQPIVVDLTKRQAKSVISKIQRHADKAEKFAFELSKTGSGQETVVSLDVVIDDLPKKQAEVFEKVKGQEFDYEIFEKCLYVKSEVEQAEDLINAGFDVTKLGIDPVTVDKDKTNDNQEEKQAGGEDLGF